MHLMLVVRVYTLPFFLFKKYYYDNLLDPIRIELRNDNDGRDNVMKLLTTSLVFGGFQCALWTAFCFLYIPLMYLMCYYNLLIYIKKYLCCCIC